MIKKITKKISTVFIFVIFCYNNIFAYNPSNQDKTIIKKIDNIITDNIEQQEQVNVSLVDWYYAFDTIQLLQKPDTKVDYIIKEMKKDLRKKINNKKIGTNNTIIIQKSIDENFAKITNENPLNPKCFVYQELLDDYARALDIPTALIGATWQIEANCNYKYYKNGVFQIMAKNYEEQKMTKSFLIKQIKDFDLFIKHKRNRYNRTNKNKGGSTVQITYSQRSIEDLIKHGALYNGLSGKQLIGDIQPMQTYYVYGNSTEKYRDAIKDGLITNFIKYLVQQKKYINKDIH